MKICAVICEFNPLHNGHAYFIQQARKLSDCDFLVAIMSGAFVQRGEVAVLNATERARHAVLAGADCVIELPTVFATANAEIFADGALSVLAEIPHFTHLAFGCEDGDAEDFLHAGECSLCEDEPFKEQMRQSLATGVGYARARTAALRTRYPDLPEPLLTKPNNLLGVEYAKAVLKRKPEVTLCPIRRLGANYNDTQTVGSLSSARAIRLAMQQNDQNAVFNNVPPFTFVSLQNTKPHDANDLIVSALIRSERAELSRILDCTEGLENRLLDLAYAGYGYGEIVSEASGKRYTKARIRRILLGNFLRIDRDLISEALCSPLYLRVLAVNATKAKELFGIFSNSRLPILTRKSDYDRLNGAALRCMQTDVRAKKLADLIHGESNNPYFTLFV